MKEKLVAHRKPTGRRVELLLDGKPVSWAELPYLELRVGRAVLRTGGIGDVFTQREQRGKGYSRRVLEHCVEVMTGDGLDVGLLFGIPDFYHKFGFRTSLSDYETLLPGRTVVDLPMTLRARVLPKRRHAEVLPLYAREVRRRGFGIERSRRTWPGYRRGARWPFEVKVVGFYRGRRLVGYLVTDDDPKEVRVPELAAGAEGVLPSMLAWLGRECRRKVAEHVKLYLPPDHPASRAAVELGAELRRTTRGTGGPMMRLLNLGPTVAAMMPELLRRWSASPLGRCGLDLTLQTDIGTAELAVPPSGPDADILRGRVRIPQNRLVQLVVGYLPLEQVARSAGVAIPRRLTAALGVLFPERCPSILSTNCF